MALRRAAGVLAIMWVLTACTGNAPTEVKIPTDGEIKARIVRTAERKANGVFYSISDKLPDNKGDTWRVNFLKIFRQSGKVYEFVEVRVDPRYGEYTISPTKPLTIKLGTEILELPNESQERLRVGYYEITAQFGELIKRGQAELTLSLGEGERTIVIDQGVFKGWEKVRAIQGPNEFYAGANY